MKQQDTELNDLLETVAALTAEIQPFQDDLLDVWGAGCVELYQYIGQCAKVVAGEAAVMWGLLESNDEEGSGVFAYEVAEEVGTVLRNIIMGGGCMSDAEVLHTARQLIINFLEPAPISQAAYKVACHE